MKDGWHRQRRNDVEILTDPLEFRVWGILQARARFKRGGGLDVGEFWITLKELSYLLECDRSKAQRFFRKLVRLGWIRPIPKAITRRSRKVSVYAVCHLQPDTESDPVAIPAYIREERKKEEERGTNGEAERFSTRKLLAPLGVTPKKKANTPRTKKPPATKKRASLSEQRDFLAAEIRKNAVTKADE